MNDFLLYIIIYVYYYHCLEKWALNVDDDDDDDIIEFKYHMYYSGTNILETYE